MLNRLLTLREVAAYLQIDSNTVYRWCREDRIPAIKIGKEWRVDQRDLDLVPAGKENHAGGKSLEAILPHQLTAPEHTLVMLTEPEKVFELEVAFFQAAYARGYPMLKACWWQHPDEARRRLTDAGIPVRDLEAQGDFVLWDLWPVYRNSGPEGIFALWEEQAQTWAGEVFWGSGSHLLDEWSENWTSFLDYEERLHDILCRLPGVVICPCVATPAVADGARELLNLVPHHTGILVLSEREPVTLSFDSGPPRRPGAVAWGARPTQPEAS